MKEGALPLSVAAVDDLRHCSIAFGSSSYGGDVQ